MEIRLFKVDTFPDSFRGVSQKLDGYYRIIINSKLSPDEQTAVFLHEMLHIYHNDHDRYDTAEEIETERHAELVRLLQMLK